MLVAVVTKYNLRKDLKDYNEVLFRCFRKANILYNIGESTRMLVCIFNRQTLTVVIMLLIPVAGL